MTKRTNEAWKIGREGKECRETLKLGRCNMAQESLSRGLCTDKCLCFLLSTHPIENNPCLPGEGQVFSCGVHYSTGQTRNCSSAENDVAKWRSHRRECHSAGTRRHTQPLIGLGPWILNRGARPREAEALGLPLYQAQNLVKPIQACKDEIGGRTGQNVRGLQVLLMGTL